VNDWKIEMHMPFTGTWHVMAGFSAMQKSYAAGAWAMLRSFYNHKQRHRLVKGDVVIEEIGLQTVGL